MIKILRIDMGAKGGPKSSVEISDNYKGLGGRAMTSAIISQEVPPMCFPLGEENKLVIAPGLISGSSAAQSGRVSVGCKSPLTCGIKESNTGGLASRMIAKLGYAAIVLEGKPEGDHLYKIFINKNGVHITTADELKMLGNIDLIESIKKHHGNKVACITIGPVGEMKRSVASIAFTDLEFKPTRHTGRWGMGAVMGSKKIKAIILDDSGIPDLSPEYPDKFIQLNDKFIKGLIHHSELEERFPIENQMFLNEIMSSGQKGDTDIFLNAPFDIENKFNPFKLERGLKRNENVTQGCQSSCVIQCIGSYMDKKGEHMVRPTEYKTIWTQSKRCGIKKPEIINKIDRLNNDYGIDTIEILSTIAVAMEAGIEEFADSRGAIRLVHAVGKGTHLGRILGSGASVTRKIFGIEEAPPKKASFKLTDRKSSPQSIIGSYLPEKIIDNRSMGEPLPANLAYMVKKAEPFKYKSQTANTDYLQVIKAAIDTTGYCLFVTLSIIDQPETLQNMIHVINAYTGKTMTQNDLISLGRKILAWEDAFNKKAGITKKQAQDNIPKRYMNELYIDPDRFLDIPDEEPSEILNS